MDGYMLALKDLNESELDVEMHADGYAHHCGYGTDLVEALESLRSHAVLGFEKPAIQKRIDALTTSPRINLVPIPEIPT